jgi:Ser/Thr protein kinase RdoA (MazF antagonist)
LKLYESLTVRGKARRLRQLALQALEQYDLEIAGIRLVGMFTNTLFRVNLASGAACILRVCRPGWRTDTDLQSEVTWLLALDRETRIGAPHPLPARNGDFIVTARAAGVPEARRCMLMSWLPGILLEKRLSEQNLLKMGVLFASLHAQAAGFSPPPGFTRRNMSSLFVRGEEDVLLGEACHEAFSDHNRDIFEKARRLVEAAFERLYAHRDGLCVIHNDLWHGNIKIFRGRLHPFDFEDTLWGYPVQDIAMAFQDLMMDVSPEQFEPFQQAFRRGYESCLEWPESEPGQIDAFRVGRMLWVANYVARFEREYLAGHITRVAPLLERFLETGILHK